MPLVTLSFRKGRTPEHKQALMQAVHASLVEAFQIPTWDLNQRIWELDPENFQIPSTKSEKYTIVEMTVFPGRSLEAKKKLYQLIVTKLEALGIQRADVVIVLHEPALDNWGVKGGVPASQVDIGFKVDV
jgi:phenylpyruvate tautomerase PptA (4-oxalocrotonate tautomerase family)